MKFNELPVGLGYEAFDDTGQVLGTIRPDRRGNWWFLPSGCPMSGREIEAITAKVKTLRALP